MVLPPRPDADDDLAAAVLDRLDGLVIAGGADVEASRYDAPPHPTSQPPRPDRDAWELALARVSAELDLPVLGDLPRHAGHGGRGRWRRSTSTCPTWSATTRTTPVPGEYASHHATPVEPAPGWPSCSAPNRLDVPTYHHQAVRAQSLEGTAYRPSAWHADGTLEAMEDPTAGFRLAVQWHPEAGDDGRLFEALVAAAAEASGVRRAVLARRYRGEPG